MPNIPSQTDLRRACRAKRQQLSPRVRAEASAAICERLKQCCLPHDVLALYLAMPEEVDLAELMTWAWARGKTVEVPMVQADQSLKLCRITSQTTMQENAWGIREPVEADTLDWQTCGLIVLPLVAFDADRNRVGMGGGFYDRLLSGLSENSRPACVGAAFECQRVPAIVPHPWDVRLDGVITEVRSYF